MNWLSNFVKPKLRKIFKNNVLAQDLWISCPDCEQLIFYKALEENLFVCPHCGFHMTMKAESRADLLLTGAKEIPYEMPGEDPLNFVDKKKYKERLIEARSKTKLKDAVVLKEGLLGSHKVVLAVFDFFFIGGSMGRSVGNAMIKGLGYSKENNLPFILITASGGARMQEGVLSLFQMARVLEALRIFKQGRSPFITVAANPTTGGVAASFGLLGDIVLAEPKAIIGFTGARVIKDFLKEELPKNFQTAEQALKNGMIDQICERKELPNVLSRILSFFHN